MSPQILASGGFLKSDGSNMYLDFSYAVSVWWGTKIGLWSFGKIGGFSHLCSSSLDVTAPPLAAYKSQSLLIILKGCFLLQSSNLCT